MAIAEKIVLLRKERGWSQAELAKRLGILQQYLSTWETGKNVPQTSALIKLSQLLEVSVDYLLFDNVPRQCATEADFELYDQFRQASTLSDKEKEAIKQLVSAMVFRSKVKSAEDDAEKGQPKERSVTTLRRVAGKR